MINNNIILFLTNRAWVIGGEDNSFIGLRPPIEFQLPDDYLLYIPKSLEKVDSNVYINNVLNIISDFYSLSLEDLNTLINNEDSILKVRVYDEETEGGMMPLNRFEQFIENIRAILRDTASFVIHKNVLGKQEPHEVSRYLNKCNFMQTEMGSFVAKIQLPSNEIIKSKNLFEDEISSDEINSKLSEILSFVTKDILEENTPYSDELLIENKENINVRLYQDVVNLFEKADVSNIDFSLHTIKSSYTINSRDITKEKIYNLTQFVEKINESSTEIGVVTIKGQITALKSKDPDGLKNSVTYVGLYDNMPITAFANLDSEHYKSAIEAHKLKQNIIITGLAKIAKFNARFVEITKFEVGN